MIYSGKNATDHKGGNEEFNRFWSIKYMSKVQYLHIFPFHFGPLYCCFNDPGVSDVTKGLLQELHILDSL